MTEIHSQSMLMAKQFTDSRTDELERISERFLARMKQDVAEILDSYRRSPLQIHASTKPSSPMTHPLPVDQFHQRTASSRDDSGPIMEKLFSTTPILPAPNKRSDLSDLVANSTLNPTSQSIKHQRLVPLKYSCEEVWERMGNGFCLFCEEKDSPEHQLKHKRLRIVVMECDDHSFDEETKLEKAEVEPTIERLIEPVTLVSVLQGKIRGRQVFDTIPLLVTSKEKRPEGSPMIKSAKDVELSFSHKATRVWEPGGLPYKLDHCEWPAKVSKSHRKSRHVETLAYPQMHVMNGDVEDLKTEMENKQGEVVTDKKEHMEVHTTESGGRVAEPPKVEGVKDTEVQEFSRTLGIFGGPRQLAFDPGGMNFYYTLQSGHSDNDMSPATESCVKTGTVVRVTEGVQKGESHTDKETKPTVSRQIKAVTTKVSNSLVEPVHWIEEFPSVLLTKSVNNSFLDDLHYAMEVDVWLTLKVEQVYVLDMDLVDRLTRQSTACNVDLVIHHLLVLLFPKACCTRQQRQYKSWKYKYKGGMMLLFKAYLRRRPFRQRRKKQKGSKAWKFKSRTAFVLFVLTCSPSNTRPAVLRITLWSYASWYGTGADSSSIWHRWRSKTVVACTLRR